MQGHGRPCPTPESLHGRVSWRSGAMGVESARVLNAVDAFIGDTIMVATSDAPEEGAPCRLVGVDYGPSVHVPHNALQAAALLEVPGRRICIEVRFFRNDDAVVRGENQ